MAVATPKLRFIQRNGEEKGMNSIKTRVKTIPGEYLWKWPFTASKAK
jgi:hypothetical protein